MAGCTDLAFRLIAREKGMEFAFLEMISAHALVRGNRRTLRVLETLPEDRPLGAQIVGYDPDVMGRAAARVEEMGFDVLDLNLGCPAPKITRGGKGGGSALLARPAEASLVFRAVMGAVSRIPVTVKMRIGFTDPSGDEAVEAAKRAEDAGLHAVTVHGRTRTQGYSGRADYEAIARVKRAVSIPVIGNGDVYSGEDARRLCEASGCDGVMLGRGALGNPWIYRETAAALRGAPPVEPPGWEERRDTLLRHMELEARFQGEERAVLHMRRISCWYVSGVPCAAIFRKKVCAAKSLSEVRDLILGMTPGSASGG